MRDGNCPVQVRMAMAVHSCHRCGVKIRPGDRHLVITTMPSRPVDDPVRRRECRRCVLKRGQGGMLGDDVETTRVIVEALAAEWADDLSFVSPSEMAEQLLKAMDGAR